MKIFRGADYRLFLARKMNSKINTNIALGIILTGYAIMKRNKKQKKYWSKSWLMRRNKLGVTACLLRELRDENVQDYCRFLRIEPETFDHLLHLIGDKICKQDTRMRWCISAETRLALTLRYLATGEKLCCLLIFLHKYIPI
jgi:hypothetical protein